MSTENKQLTLEDLVDEETLADLQRLQDTRVALSEKNLWLDREKVRILAADRKLDDQERRIFEKCLVDRGLSPRTVIDIDTKTGRISLVEDPKEE